MDTGTDLSIYTNIFGWYYFNLFIQLISSYGLWIIGFLYLLWQATFSLASRNGRYNPKSSLLNAEYNIYLMLFILVFAIIPTISVGSNFFHNNGKTSGKTETAFDALNVNTPSTVKLPAAWFIVWKTNAAITAVFRAAFPNEKDMRKAMTNFQDLMVTDPKLSSEVGNFSSLCHKPTLAAYKTLERDYPASKLYKEIQTTYQTEMQAMKADRSAPPAADLYYPGNKMFTDHLYRPDLQICSATDDPKSVSCLPRMNRVDNTMVSQSSGGFANCLDWWGSTGGLESKIGQHMEDTRADDVGLIESVFSFFGADVVKRDIVNKSLTSNAAPEIRSPYNEGVWNDIKNSSQAFVLNWVNWIAAFLNATITAFLPQLHAVMILLLLIMAPIISIVGLARPAAIMRLLLVAFIINLWIPMWILVNWIDNVLLSLLYSNQGWIAGIFDLGYTLTSLLTLTLYTAIPLLVSYYIYIATSNSIANMTTQMAGAGGAAGTAAGMGVGGVVGGARNAKAVGSGVKAVGGGARRLTGR